MGPLAGSLAVAHVATALLLGGCYHAGLVACRAERERLFVHVTKHAGGAAARRIAREAPAVAAVRVDWREHLALLVDDDRLVVPERHHLGPRGVVRELHRVTLRLDGLSLRNLPHVVPYEWVALGVVMDGVRGRAGPLRRVLGVAMADGRHAALRLGARPLAEGLDVPTEALTLTFVVQPIPAMEAEWLRRLRAPRDDAAADRRYAAIFERHRARPAWRYVFRWYAGDSVHNEVPARSLLHGQHALVVTPPPGAPRPVFDLQVTPATLRGCVVRGAALVRAGTGAACDATPYLLLRVLRASRETAAR